MTTPEWPTFSAAPRTFSRPRPGTPEWGEVPLARAYPTLLQRRTDAAMNALWIVERTSRARFPFRVSIEQAGRLVVAFRAQARWPGPGQQIFCLRERELDPAEPLEPLERVPVAHLTRVGRKLTIVLDRPNRKRCEFLVVRKPRRDGAGEHEQIFFRTESGIRSHRSRTRVELRSGRGAAL